MLTLLLLSLVTYRITRFLIDDTLIDNQRIWVHQLLVGKSSKFRYKLYELVTCKFCLSIWVAAVVTACTDAVGSVPMPVWMWLGSAAGALVVWQVAEQ